MFYLVPSKYRHITKAIRLSIIRNWITCGSIESLESGKLTEVGVVTEESAGSTAISFATVAPNYGCKYHVVIPDDTAVEKARIIEAIVATVERVRGVSITHIDHFVNVARRRAMEANALASKHQYAALKDGKKRDGEKQSSIFPTDCTGGFFADQVDNMAKLRAHYEGTGPEIWEQSGDHLDAFIAAAGTGGTVASVSRLTLNFMMANLDGALQGAEREAVEMSRLFLGRSSAMHCVGSVRVPLSASGVTHLSKFYDAQYLFQLGPLQPD